MCECKLGHVCVNQEWVITNVSLIGLFSELDSQPDLGVTNYGVSMTTLEDVFLRLEAETEVDQAGAYVANANGGTWRHKKMPALTSHSCL